MTWWEARSPAVRATLTGGASTSTGALRPTSLLTTSSTCFSEVASHPVSGPVCVDAHFLSYNFSVTPLMTKKVMAALCCPACLQRVHTPSTMAEQATAMTQTTDKREPMTEEMYVSQFVNANLLFSLMCVCRRGMLWLFCMTLCVCC